LADVWTMPYALRCVACVARSYLLVQWWFGEGALKGKLMVWDGSLRDDSRNAFMRVRVMEK
jgi:hypothetical protein